MVLKLTLIRLFDFVIFYLNLKYMVKKVYQWAKNRLTPAVFIVVLINVFVALLFAVIQLLTNVELQFTFSMYPTYSNDFHVYQLFTFMFVHSTDLLHVIMNVFFILMFAPFMERKLGATKFILAYFICAWMGFLFINYSYYKDKSIVEKSIRAIGINPNSIPLDNRHVVKLDYLSSLEPKEQKIVRDYNWITSKSNGASGALFGFIVFYLFLNLLNYRKIIYLLIGLYLVYGNVSLYFAFPRLSDGSVYAHLGGMFGGLLLTIWFFWNQKKTFLKKE